MGRRLSEFILVMMGMAVLVLAGPPRLDLYRVVEAALASHPQLREASENCRLAQARWAYSRGQFVPALGLGARLQRTEFESLTMGSQTSWTSQLAWQTQWGVSVAPKLSFANGDSAVSSAMFYLSLPLSGKTSDYYSVQDTYFQADRLAAEATYQHTKAQVLVQVVSAYWSWVEGVSRVRLAAQVLAAREDMETKLKKLVLYEVRPSSDVWLAGAETRHSQITGLEAKQARNDAATRLSELTGLTVIGADFEVGTGFPGSELIIVKAPVTGRPLRADYRALEAFSASQLAYANSLQLQEDTPISVLTGVGVDRFGQRGLSYDAMLSITLPLWDTKSDSVRLNYRVVSDRFQRQLVALAHAIHAQEQQDYLRLGDAWRMYQFSIDEERDYDRIYKNEVRKMALGVSTFLDVLNQNHTREGAIFQRLGYHRGYAEARLKWGYSSGTLLNTAGDVNWSVIGGERHVEP